MKWKDISYWLKGGLIAMGLYLLSLFENRIAIYLSYPIISIYFALTGESGAIYNFVPFIISSIIFYFIIGALIGLIISKIKSKK